MSNNLGVGSEKHPEYLAMKAAIESEYGRELAVAAAAKGRPALEGVDAMLTETFVRYRDKYHMSLKNAGMIVARLMRDDLGYSQGKIVSCAVGCTATSASMFIPKENKG